MDQRTLPATALILLATFATSASAWPDQPCPDGSLPVVTSHHYEVGGALFEDIAQAKAGTDVTVAFTMEGCGKRAMSFVAYKANADFAPEEMEVDNYAIEYFVEGKGSLTVQVPDCHYELAFVYGSVIFSFDAGTYGDRLIDRVQAGAQCPTGNETMATTDPTQGPDSAQEETGGPPADPETGDDLDGTVETTAEDADSGAASGASPPCPTGLAAEANADGSITLTFTPPPGSDGSNVFRAEGDGDFTFAGHLAAGVATITDSDTRPGVAYSYMVTGTFGDVQSEGCAAVEVAAIPEFPTGVAMTLAAACGLLSYAFLRRKK